MMQILDLNASPHFIVDALIKVTAQATGSATNTNNDQDMIEQTSSNTNNNTNGGKKRKKRSIKKDLVMNINFF